MGAVPQRLLNWLHGALTSEYRNASRTYSDVAQTLSYHPNISLRTDVYTYENGISSLLLNMQGILPVVFRGTTYAFPISIWVPQEYPSSAPISFVSPTKDMAVRPGQHVSAEGRIYHPYLANWRDDISTLLEFFSILQDIFSKEPPVVARQEQQRHPEQPNANPPPVPPLPPELGGQRENKATPQSPTSSQPPPPPPKPFSPRANASPEIKGPPPLPPLPAKPESPYSTLRQVGQYEFSRSPQPIPRQPPQRASSLHTGQFTASQALSSLQLATPTPQQRALNHLNTPSRQNSYQADATASNHPRYVQQEQSLPQTGYAMDPSVPRYRDGQQQIPQPQSHPQLPPKQNQQQTFAQPQPSRQSVSKHNPPDDLLTSPFENAPPPQPTNIAPPPIPPNPHKDALLSALSQTLTQQINSSYTSNLSALPPLRAQQTALTATLNAINAEMTQLNELETLLSSNEAILHQAMRDADKVLDDAKRRKVPNIDEVLVAPTIVAGQLYANVAEERAIEDSRAVLGKALDKGRIGGGLWAKQTRSLAREEFLKKALIKKISRGMGLADDDRWA